MTKTYTAAQRKEQLIDIGAKLGAKLGIVNVQRQLVADKAGCAHSLVSVYLGDAKSAQAAYRKRMKKLGLTEPPKEKIDAIGVEARKHKVKTARDTRKRSPKEVEAIKRKRAAKSLPKATSNGEFERSALVSAKKSSGVSARKSSSNTSSATREVKPTAPAERKPTPSPAKPSPQPASQPAQRPPERKTAARLPMAPPTRPADPVELPRCLTGAFP